MAAPNRYAIREAGIATFFSLDTGDAIVTLDTLKMTEVETNGETVYAQGGRGNAKLVGFSSDREARVTLEDAIFDNLAMAMLTGNEVTEGVKTVNLIHRGMTDETGSIELPKIATGITTAYILDEDGRTNKTKIADPSVTGTTVDLGAENDEVMVRVYYTAETDATAKTIKVTSEDFGGTFKVVVDVMVRDENKQQDFYGQFIANRAKIEDEFTFSFAPDGDPSVLNIPLEILKDGNNDMWELVLYDDEGIASE